LNNKEVTLYTSSFYVLIGRVLEEISNNTEVTLNWWDVGSPGVLDIGDIGAFLAALVAFGAVFAGISRWWMRSLRVVIKEEIEVATEPIHPGSNGGLSLADVARKTTELEKSLKTMHRYNQETRNLLLKALTNSLEMPNHAPEDSAEEASKKPSKSRKKS